jgi:hypothetical protein
LFQNFSDKINNQTGEIPEHDRDDFLKPVMILNANNEQIVMPSEASKTSKISSNYDLKKQSHNEMICYTNEIRETPSNSFYEAKKEEIQHIIEIADEESKRDTTPDKHPIEQDDEDFEEDEDDDFDEFDEVADSQNEARFKEDTPAISEKKQLSAPGGEQMTDYNDKTKGRKLEIHKKNTVELEKEDHHSKKIEAKDAKDDIVIELIDAKG